MLTESQIYNDDEWVLCLKQIFRLYDMIEDKDYIYNNYLDWGYKGSIFKDIEDRRARNENTNKIIMELENKILKLK